MITRTLIADALASDRENVEIVVQEADALCGMRRSRIREEGRREAQDGGDDDVDRAILRLYTYPDLIGATLSAKGIPWPLSFDEFVTLPDRLVAQWEDLVYELNPHWVPKPVQESKEDAEKKAS